MKEQIKLFLTGFVQVFLVSMNIVFITNKQIFPLVITGFFISFTWTINVKKVAFGTMLDRIIYSIGAASGTGMGYLAANYYLIH